MKFASLGSGSEGNSLLLSASSSSSSFHILIDCGFAAREAERRLRARNVAPEEVGAILVTHEHQDHIGGVYAFARRYATPVWMSFGTWLATRRDADGVDVRFCRDGHDISIGGLVARPYTVPHDAREPLQYVVSEGAARLGILTDAGQSTPHLVDALSSCNVLLLECNHDRRMLENSTYPASLRRRIGGGYGHLSNETAAQILSDLDRSRLRLVIAAHLSQQNNTPDLARAALGKVADEEGIEVGIACQKEGFGWTMLTP